MFRDLKQTRLLYRVRPAPSRDLGFMPLLSLPPELLRVILESLNPRISDSEVHGDRWITRSTLPRHRRLRRCMLICQVLRAVIADLAARRLVLSGQWTRLSERRRDLNRFTSSLVSIIPSQDVVAALRHCTSVALLKMCCGVGPLALPGGQTVAVQDLHIGRCFPATQDGHGTKEYLVDGFRKVEPDHLSAAHYLNEQTWIDLSALTRLTVQHSINTRESDLTTLISRMPALTLLSFDHGGGFYGVDANEAWIRALATSCPRLTSLDAQISGSGDLFHSLMQGCPQLKFLRTWRLEFADGYGQVESGLAPGQFLPTDLAIWQRDDLVIHVQADFAEPIFQNTAELVRNPGRFRGTLDLELTFDHQVQFHVSDETTAERAARCKHQLDVLAADAAHRKQFQLKASLPEGW